jgi:hypothetical protein
MFYCGECGTSWRNYSYKSDAMVAEPDAPDPEPDTEPDAGK